MPVAAADPEATALDAAFAEAMGAAPKPKEPPAPPEIDPEAPHGREEDGSPKAPYGFTKEGRPKLTAGGRKRRDEDKARVTKAPVKDDAKTGTVIPPKDFSKPLTETADGIWVGMTFLGQIPLADLPLVGKIPLGKGKTLGDKLAGAERKLQAQAHILNANKGALVGALNLAANNSPRARRLVEKLETGDATWAIMCGAMMAPFVMQSRALWAGTLAENEMPSVDEMARANAANFDAWSERVSAMLSEAAQAAQEGASLPQAA